MHLSLLAFLLLASTTQVDEPAVAPPPEPDAGIVALLGELGYEYDIDEDGDFSLVFDVDSEGERSQLVWIRNRTYGSDEMPMRDVWSIAVRLPGRFPSVKLGDQLLRESYETHMGAWARDKEYLVYIVKLPAQPTRELLNAALVEVIDMADALELEKTKKDEF